MTPPLHAGCLITLLGAPRRRSALVLALHERLRARGVGAEALPCPASPEAPTAAWCTAREDELQAALARSLVLDEGGLPHAAALRGETGSAELQAAAGTQLARSALVLLCAPDTRATPEARELDTRLRALLLAARCGFSVVHGDGAAALAQAWQALCVTVDRRLDNELPVDTRGSAAWRWACDKCSDPACEHRVFSDLVARREDT